MRAQKLLETLSSRPFLVWEYLLSSLLLACVVARGVAIASDAFFPQKYTQLVVGNLAWEVGSKHPDYLLLLSFILSLFLIYIGLQWFAASIQGVNGEAAEAAFREILIYALLPAGVWIGNIFVNSKPTLEFIIVSAVLVLLAIAFTAGLLHKRFVFLSSADHLACTGSSLLTILLALLSGNALFLALARLNLNWQFTETQVILASVSTVLVVGCLLIVVWIWRKSDLKPLQKRLRSLLGIAQLFLPLSFFILLPTPWVNHQQKFYGYSISPILYIVLISLVLLNYLDIIWRLRKPTSYDITSIFSIISPLSLIALLIYMKSPITGVSFIPPDDYHWGEFLLPWWLLKQFHYIPFQDYEPARGLINYVPGFLADLFFDQTAASYLAVTARAPQFLPYLTIGFLVISRSIGVLPAFLALALIPNPNNIYEIDLMLTAGLCILVGFFLKQKPVSWLGIWLILCMSLFLFAPGQGGLFTIATFPLAAFMLYQAIRQQRQNLIKTAIAIAVIAIFLSLVTPLDQMMLGAVRYGVEQSALNSVAYGAEWFKSVGSNTFLTYPLWEFLRTSWIVISALIGFLVYQTIIYRKVAERQRFLIFAIPLFLITILIIPRAAGRIDSGTFSRLGLTSVWTMCLVLPIILLSCFGQRAKALILIVFAILGSLLTSGMEETLPSLERLVQHPVQAINVTGMNFIDGKQVGLPTLDNAILDPEHLQRLQRMKAILSTLLKPKETYLDLTNKNARYFHLNYAPPMPAAAYNLVHINQQRRTIQKVESHSVPIAVALADLTYLDYYSLALRTHLLYRYVAENYIPFKVDEFIFMIRPEYRDRLNQLTASQRSESGFSSGVLIGDTEALRLNLLDRAFRVANFEGIPSSWGRSLNSLPVRKISDIPFNPTLQSIEHLGGDRYKVTGTNPTITLDLSSLKVNGRDSGLLAFDFACKKRSKGKLAIRWESVSTPPDPDAIVRLTPRNGKQIVPLDAAPRWLLAKDIQTLKLEPFDQACTEFSLSNFSLYQRADVANN